MPAMLKWLKLGSINCIALFINFIVIQFKTVYLYNNMFKIKFK